MGLWRKYIMNTQKRQIEWKRIKSWLSAHPKAIAWAVGLCLLAGGLLNGMLVSSLRSASGNTVFSWNPLRLLGYGTIFSGSFPGWIFISAILLFATLSIGRKYILERQLINDEGEYVQSLTGEYGTARQLEDEEKKKLFLSSKNIDDLPGDILGIDKDTDEPFCLNPKADYLHQICPHKLVAASSGRGKTRTIILNDIEQSIRRGESFVCTDPKGEIYKYTFLWAKENGYKVRVLNLVDMINSDGINFLSLVNYNSKKALAIADNIVRQTVDGDNDIFLNGAKALIACGILMVAMEPKWEGKRNLYEVFKFLNGRTILQIAQDVANSAPSNPARDQWDFFISGSPNLQGSIMSNAGSMLSIYAIPEVRAIISHDETDLVAPAIEKCAYYVVIPSSDRTYDAITAQYFSLLLRELEVEADRHESQRVKIPVNIIMEEFANCGRVPNITGALTTFRSRGIKITIVIQGIEQLQRLYPNLMWRDFISNTDIKIVLGVNDVENAKFWSELTGDATIEVENVGEDESSSSNQQIRTGKGKRYLMTPHEVAVLSRARELLFIGGFNVMVAKKFDFSMHPDTPKLKKQLACEHIPEWWRDKDVQNERWFKHGFNMHEAHMQVLEQEKAEMEREEKLERAQAKEEEQKAKEEFERELANNTRLRLIYNTNKIKDQIKSAVLTEDGKLNTDNIKATALSMKTKTMTTIHDVARKLSNDPAPNSVPEEEKTDAQPMASIKEEVVAKPVIKPVDKPIKKEIHVEEHPSPTFEEIKAMMKKQAEAPESNTEANVPAQDEKTQGKPEPSTPNAKEMEPAEEEEEDEEGVEYTPSIYSDDEEFVTDGTAVTFSERESAQQSMKQIQEEMEAELRSGWVTKKKK